MKKFLALLIFGLVSLPAEAGSLCLTTLGPPERYGQYFAQCTDTTMTVAQQLACISAFIAFDPPPPAVAGQMAAFIKRGWALVEAERYGLISNGEARTRLAETMADTRYRVQAKFERRIPVCYQTWCDAFGYSPVCNGY